MCRFRVNGRPICHIFHCFKNVPASRERSLINKSVNSKLENLHTSDRDHILDLVSWRLYYFSSIDLGFTMILDFSKFSMNRFKSNENADILKKLWKKFSTVDLH